jgi:hypothetical protein
VGSYSASADPASEDKFIAAISAGFPVTEKIIVTPKDDTGKPIRAKRPTATPKIAADTALAKTTQKTWMIHLQHHYPKGL